MKGVLISGGSRGIGASTVRKFTSGGWSVAFLYEKCDEAADTVAKETGARAIRCDVSSRDDAFRSFQQAERWLGRVDCLVCCAGVAGQALFQDVTQQEWRRMLDVNLSGAAYLAQAALPGMISRKSGVITFVSSVWGVRGAACEVHYSAAKAGLIGLTKALCKEVGPSGVRVNAVAPGVIDTDMIASLDACARAALIEETPLGRLGAADDVSDAIDFLCSERARFITGQVLGVDGGFAL